ncbi:glycoprotease family protein [Babesia divergens]|uniref:N(6)-L-threonylcarbamoyladenine synthase n=1 Tax=Babesia divergens TaxID=32595 RepID=A0AAD9G738_BABDI|nr:glycoprotease family protein [Babesia divergens]
MNAEIHNVRKLINYSILLAICLAQPGVHCVRCRGTVAALDNAAYPIQCGFIQSSAYKRHETAVYTRILPVATEVDEIPPTYAQQLSYHRRELLKSAPPLGSKYYIIAIETSCDDACVAILSSDGDVLAEEHASNPESLVKYGGIKPDEYSRFHSLHIDTIIQAAIEKSGVSMSEVKRIAVTRGPGMNICLKVGYDAALKLAATYGIPIIGENHLAGHCLSPLIKGHQFKVTYGKRAIPSTDLKYPFLSLLLSGGHSQIYVVENAAKFHMLSDTMDHYAGNVLHKCARDLGLSLHNGGGPSIEAAAKRVQGAPLFDMTEPCKDMCFTSFCFSGIQTQLRDIILNLREQYGDDFQRSHPDIVDQLAHTCQEVVFKQILRQVKKALDICDNLFGINQLVVVGGVSCNERLREMLAEMLKNRYRTTSERTALFTKRMYGYIQKFGPLRRLDRSDTHDNILIRNLLERMRGVKDVPQFLKLLWSQDLYPDLLQRREGVHLSVQHKNALYSASLQAYLSLLSDEAVQNLHRNIHQRREWALKALQPSRRIMAELEKFELLEGSALISRSMNANPKPPKQWELFTTSGRYCTDNAVMIGNSLLEKHRIGVDGLPHGTFEENVTDKWNLASRRHWELLSDISLLHSLTEY